jgi:antitoxin VapB
MALNIKNREVERLAKEVAELARETKTQAIRRALEDRKADLLAKSGRPNESLHSWLEANIWSKLPPEVLGQPPMTRDEEDEILGFGPDGY